MSETTSASLHQPTRAVILARGLGTRMRKADNIAVLRSDQSAIADTGIKGMISVGRPFLDFVLGAVADSGFSRACLVIGPEHDIVRRYYEENSRQRLAIEFAIQERPLGTANAILAAEKFADGEPFLVLNSDNYYPASALAQLRAAGPPAVAGFRRKSLSERGNIGADRLSRFGALDVDSEGYLERILVGEAAAAVPDETALASMNCWLFDNRIFAACRSVPLSARGEYELPQAVRLGIDALGMKVKVVPIDAPVLDLSSRADIESVTRALEGVEISL